MRKLLTATTALALVGGAAFAELSMSGDAKLGIDYTSEPGAGMSKHSFKHEVGIDFSGSGTTDGGLSFGGSAGFDTNDDTVNLGTVYVSGSFGKVTIGDNDPADLLAGGIADIGLNGIGVDDVAEGRGGDDGPGKSAAALRYDHSFGQVAIAISAGNKDGSAAVEAVPGIFGYNLPGQTTAYGNDLYRAQMARTAYVGTEADVTAFNTAFDTAFNTAFTNANPGVTYAAPAVGSRLNDDGVPVGADDAPLAGVALASFNHFVAHYNLGADNAVGNEDSVANGDDTRAPGASVVRASVDAVAPVSSENQYAFGMSFEAGGVTVGVGYDSLKTVSAGLGFATGDIGMNALYIKNDDGRTGLGADVSYTIGASMLTLAYARSTPASGESSDGMGINVSHDLGGGASMVAGFGQVDDTNKASAGLKFSF